MDNDKQAEALTYAQDKPDVVWLKDAYDRTINELGWYFESARDSYNYRRNIWPGKSKDMRKNTVDAFPFKGASDTEAGIIDERVDTYVALFMSALARANIRAYPVEMGDMGRARIVSSFLKWMVSSYIPDFRRQMELGANYLLERGLMVTYVGWQKEQRTFLQQLSLEQLMAVSPDLVAAIKGGQNDDQLVQLFTAQFPDTKQKRIRKAIKQLREQGKAELPVSRTSVNCPHVAACAPDADVFFPAYAMDPQKAPYCFWRVLMTAQEIKAKVAAEGWDEEWADYVVENCKSAFAGVDPRTSNTGTNRTVIMSASNELYEVIYTYQRLISEEDGSEGIYLTVFSPAYIGKPDEPAYAKHELLNGYDDYPFVVTKLGEDNKRLYELQTMPEKLRGTQWQVKVERDSRIDRNSISTNPPIMYPESGEPPVEWGPAARIPYRRMGEIAFGPTPAFNPGSVEMEQTQIAQANSMVGLDHENPLSGIRQQHYVNKFLAHVRDVLRLAFKCYQRFGPEVLFFRVTGTPDMQKMGRGDPNEDFDIMINFDVMSNDPENLEKQLQQFVSLMQFDRNGKMNADVLLEVMASAVNPVMADAILQPAQQASEQITRQVTDDLSKIYAGIEVPARPNGAQMAMQIIQQYLQQPDVMERAQQDRAFQERIKKYAEQYTFQLKQMQNAQIGKIGTAPAQMGGMQMQGVNMGVGA